jgi:hypothetical protein
MEVEPQARRRLCGRQGWIGGDRRRARGCRHGSGGGGGVVPAAWTTRLEEARPVVSSRASVQQPHRGVGTGTGDRSSGGGGAARRSRRRCGAGGVDDEACHTRFIRT